MFCWSSSDDLFQVIEGISNISCSALDMMCFCRQFIEGSVRAGLYSSRILPQTPQNPQHLYSTENPRAYAASQLTCICCSLVRDLHAPVDQFQLSSSAILCYQVAPTVTIRLAYGLNARGEC